MDQQQNITCPSCGVDNPAETKFCRSCGTKLIADAPKPPKEKKPKKENGFFARFPLMRLIRSGVMLILAIVIFATSFSSVLTYNQELDKEDAEFFKELYDIKASAGDKISVKISPLDTVVLFFDSMASKDDDKLYEDWKEKIEKLEEKYENFEPKSLNDLAKYTKDEMKVSLRMDLQSEDEPINIGLGIAALVSLTYLAIGLVLLILAIINFIFFWVGKGSYLNGCTKALTVMPVLAFLAHYTTKAGMASVYNAASNGLTVGMGSALGVLIVALIGIVAFIVLRFIFAAKTIVLKKFIFNAISLVISVACLMMVFVGALSVNIKTEFEGSSKATTASTTVSPDYFGSIEKPVEVEDDYDYSDYVDHSYMREYYKEIGDNFSKYKKSEIEDGTADAQIQSVITEVVSFATDDSVAYVFGLATSLYYTLVAIFISMVVWQNINYLATGDTSKALNRVDKIFSIILSSFILLFVIIFFVFTADYLTGNFTVGLGVGPILLLILSIVMTAFPNGGKKQVVQYVRQEYVEE